MTITTEHRWATIPQVAVYSTYATRTVRQRVKDGDLPAYKPHGSRVWLIDLNDVDKMIEQGHESLAARIRRVLGEHELPADLTDDQIVTAVRHVLRQLVGSEP